MERFLHITKKELFYTAVMLQLRQLINVVYDFPADENKFEQELNEARSSLRKKKLLTESARKGINLDFALCSCVAFCSAPERCEVINEDEYYATVYTVSEIHMLLENNTEEDFTVMWFLDKETLENYIASKIKTKKEIDD